MKTTKRDNEFKKWWNKFCDENLEVDRKCYISGIRVDKKLFTNTFAANSAWNEVYEKQILSTIKKHKQTTKQLEKRITKLENKITSLEYVSPEF